MDKLDEVCDALRRVEDKLDALRLKIEGNRKEFLTVDEIAKAVGRAPYTIRKWLQTGLLKSQKVQGAGPRGKHLIARSELDRLVTSARGGQLTDDAVA